MTNRSRQTPHLTLTPGRESYPLSLRYMNNGAGSLSLAQEYGAAEKALTYKLVLITASGQRTVYTSDASQESVIGYGLSPNDQYLTVEYSSVKDSELDLYTENSKPLAVRTRIIDLGNGQTVKDFAGFGLQWK